MIHAETAVASEWLVCAETYLSWMPAWRVRGWLAIGLAVLAVWCLLRLFWGRSLVHPRLGMWLLRFAAVAILVAILLGPMIIDEHAGAVTRPTMIYLYDGSQSMQLGQEASRWEESLTFVEAAQRAAGDDDSRDVQSFRFGHRLEPLVAAPQRSTLDSTVVSLTSSHPETAGKNPNSGSAVIAPPDASDSRLGDALRQLLPQINARQTAGVVLLSDGRVRTSDTVERLAQHIGEAQVPLHVVPIGKAAGSGDVAVVSLVVPPRVRKYTENELQVFLRSFGFTGQRTTVRLVSRNKIADGESATLASVPITLSGGAQSASLTFRVNEQPEDLVVVVDAIEGELTDRNNRVQTRVEIDRTKVRVLYIANDTLSSSDGGFFSQLATLAGSNTSSSSVFAVQAALQADEDIECSILLTPGGVSPRAVTTTGTYGTTGFPNSRAELFAYDCVVFSNVGPNVLEPTQCEWLAQWIEGRGGGLIVCGGDALLPSDWDESPLASLLPLSLENVERSYPLPTPIQVTMPEHPVWRLRLEHSVNDQLLAAIPPLATSGGTFAAKASADVLATKREDNSPVMMAQRVGRGRVLVSTASLGGKSLTELAEQWGSQPDQVAGKFWRNMVYWVTEGSSTGRRRLVAESDKRFYRPGEPLTIFATAYDEGARKTNKYRVWAMLEPASLDDMSLYSPLLWPENVVRESGESSPRVAWGEELLLENQSRSGGYEMSMMLSESGDAGDSGLRIEMTAYEGEESSSAFDHGTQVDSTSLAIQILSDPFEQQNPLPNHELLTRLAAVSGGEVLEDPTALARLLKSRRVTSGPAHRDISPAWSQWWLWLGLVGLLTTEWVWRKVSGMA